MINFILAPLTQNVSANINPILQSKSIDQVYPKATIEVSFLNIRNVFKYHIDTCSFDMTFQIHAQYFPSSCSSHIFSVNPVNAIMKQSFIGNTITVAQHFVHYIAYTMFGSSGLGKLFTNRSVMYSDLQIQGEEAWNRIRDSVNVDMASQLMDIIVIEKKGKEKRFPAENLYDYNGLVIAKEKFIPIPFHKNDFITFPITISAQEEIVSPLTYHVRLQLKMPEPIVIEISHEETPPFGIPPLAGKVFLKAPFNMKIGDVNSITITPPSPTPLIIHTFHEIPAKTYKSTRHYDLLNHKWLDDQRDILCETIMVFSIGEFISLSIFSDVGDYVYRHLLLL